MSNSDKILFPQNLPLKQDADTTFSSQTLTSLLTIMKKWATSIIMDRKLHFLKI